MDNFRRKILKVDDGGHLHKIRNSIGIYDIYKMLRKNKWLNIGRPLIEHEFYTIIRQVNNNIADNIKKGNTIKLPSFMGTFEIVKYKSSIKFENGKLKTNLPIDWNRTLELWENDKEAFRDKTVLRHELDYIYKLKYNPYKARFNNKAIFQFKFIRDIKQGISKELQKGNIDAILKYK